MTGLAALPPSAAWRHRESREGFEAVFAHRNGGGYRFEGSTSAVEGGAAWVVRYEIVVDEGWRTRTARAEGWSRDGRQVVRLDSDGDGHWRVNGSRRPDLDGCHDVDLASSACTNTFPVHRLGLGVGEGSEAPAAYVRAKDLSVVRLEQHYRRVHDDAAGRPRFDYHAPAFDFETRLVFDPSGLVLDYPHIALRTL